MQPQPLADMHPFTPTLEKWRHSIAVDCGPDWSLDVIEAAIECGPHPTACTPKAVALFEENIEYQQKAGFCKVIPWDKIKKLRPPNLKISPMAVVPQVGRGPRIILDLCSQCTRRSRVSSPPHRPVSMTPLPSRHHLPPSRKLARYYHGS
jgi:hypothetical protein